MNSLTSDKALGVVVNLFATFERKEISYCQWKSNQHLDAGLSGNTDIDLLVQLNDSESCIHILIENNFKKIHNNKKTTIHGIEHWLGFDHDTGKLIHIHLHFEIIIGGRKFKNHKLPIANIFLQNCNIYKGIKIPSPEKELLILILRVTLKADYKTILRTLTNKKHHPIDHNSENELRWLLSKYNRYKFHDVIKESKLKIDKTLFDTFINQFENKELSGLTLFCKKIRVIKHLRPHRIVKGVKLYKKIVFSYLIEMKPFSKFLRKEKKKLYSNRTFFAIVGADGAGKTRLAKDLKKWLSWKIEVKHIYLGIPKRNFFYKTKLRVFTLLKSLNKRVSKLGCNWIDSTLVKLTIWSEFKVWLSLAKRRKRLFHKAEKFRKKGNVVIAERYPLKEFWSMTKPMDGPRIQNCKNFEYLKHKEIKIYKSIKLPDAIFVLNAEIEKLRSRKQDLSYNEQNEKASAVKNLPHTQPFNKINANQKYDQVLLEVKRKIWKIL